MIAVHMLPRGVYGPAVRAYPKDVRPGDVIITRSGAGWGLGHWTDAGTVCRGQHGRFAHVVTAVKIDGHWFDIDFEEGDELGGCTGASNSKVLVRHRLTEAMS